jgi:hypothetical protein
VSAVKSSDSERRLIIPPADRFSMETIGQCLSTLRALFAQRFQRIVEICQEGIEENGPQSFFQETTA